METFYTVFEIVTGRGIIEYLLCVAVIGGLAHLFPNFFSLKE